MEHFAYSIRKDRTTVSVILFTTDSVNKVLRLLAKYNQRTVTVLG